jgi:hypothetical protein
MAGSGLVARLILTKNVEVMTGDSAMPFEMKCEDANIV